MTIAALRRLLDEIDRQGGPEAARHNSLRLDTEGTSQPMTTAPARTSAQLPAPLVELRLPVTTDPEKLPVGKLIAWGDQHDDPEIQDQAARARIALEVSGRGTPRTRSCARSPARRRSWRSAWRRSGRGRASWSRPSPRRPGGRSTTRWPRSGRGPRRPAWTARRAAGSRRRSWRPGVPPSSSPVPERRRHAPPHHIGGDPYEHRRPAAHPR